MRAQFQFLLCLCLIACNGQNYTITPTKALPEHYLDHDILSELKTKIPEMPKEKSLEQKKDEAELARLQKNRTPGDCKRAESEVVVTLKNFYGKPYGSLDDAQIAKLTPMIDKIRSEYGFYIGEFKKTYARKRPFQYIKKIKPCITVEETPAYPSGHATLATFYASILSDIYPEQSTAFKVRSEEIAQDRILGGVHHPSDIQAGKILGQLLYEELKKSPRYQAEIKEMNPSHQ